MGSKRRRNVFYVVELLGQLFLSLLLESTWSGPEIIDSKRIRHWATQKTKSEMAENIELERLRKHLAGLLVVSRRT